MQCRNSCPENAKESDSNESSTTTGDYRVEHLLVLEPELQLYEMYQQQISQCDRQIEEYLNSCDSQIESERFESGKKSSPNKKCYRNEPAFDLRSHLHRISLVVSILLVSMDEENIMTLELMFMSSNINSEFSKIFNGKITS